jgi:hypothetical protein
MPFISLLIPKEASLFLGSQTTWLSSTGSFCQFWLLFTLALLTDHFKDDLVLLLSSCGQWWHFFSSPSICCRWTIHIKTFQQLISDHYPKPMSLDVAALKFHQGFALGRDMIRSKRSPRRFRCTGAMKKHLWLWSSYSCRKAFRDLFVISIWKKKCEGSLKAIGEIVGEIKWGLYEYVCLHTCQVQ